MMVEICTLIKTINLQIQKVQQTLRERIKREKKLHQVTSQSNCLKPPIENLTSNQRGHEHMPHTE